MMKKNNIYFEKFLNKGELNYDLLSVELKKYNSISDKLDFLVKGYESVKGNLLNKETFLIVFNKLKDTCFKGVENNPQFTFWFLKYNAKQEFNFYINGKDFQHNLNSVKKRKFIKGELKKIYKIEDRAETLMIKGVINYYNRYRKGSGSLYLFNEYIEEIEALRVKNNYYVNNLTEHRYNVFSPEVSAYFKHICLKGFLEKKKEDLICSKNKTKTENVLKRTENSSSTEGKEDDNQIPLMSLNLEEVLKKQNTLIPSQKTLQIPYNFFVLLTIEKSKNGKPYLTAQQLLVFLLKAFNKQKDFPIQKMNIGTRENRRIQYFFYEFMNTTINDYENEKQLNKKYLKILTDNFKGFNYDSIISNFAKKPSNPIPTKK